MKSTTLRPGLLVSLRTSCSGNVTYNRQEIEAEATDDSGAAHARWETERTIADAKEHKAALAVQAKAGGLIRGCCVKSAFGLLCSEDAADKLQAAIEQARKLAADFNATARLTRVSVDVLTGRIASNEEMAIRAINGEVGDLLRDMERGIERLDAKMIRDAADKAREMGNMLTEGAQARVQIAIETGRKAAREISKAEREKSAAEVDKLAMVKISEMRTAFLDLSDEAAAVQTPEQRERALDLGYGVQVEAR